jgi:hypothetical protein
MYTGGFCGTLQPLASELPFHVRPDGGGDGGAPGSSPPTVKLIDTWMFNGEIAAEVRLNVTAAFFDRIIVVEAWQPHNVKAPRKSFLYSTTPYWKGAFSAGTTRHSTPRLRTGECTCIQDGFVRGCVCACLCACRREPLGALSHVLAV